MIIKQRIKDYKTNKIVWKDITIQQYISYKISNQDMNDGELEAMQRRIEYLSNIVSLLSKLLIDSGQLEFSTIENMLGGEDYSGNYQITEI